ncbi:hypothetical protein JWG45_03755 [Leptospira sp. 201903070]|uniref:Uncharacterized protein n=1 Tax=Leptospira ainlahdjerensis TaxID=2810033 RepID=A0ABS2U7F0_9LEPT|nr:hypothetical protein [Leptospira ainlahdjerensis]MBM9576262.1 hypothetical protein [Leptospira ainlahdjerensis]
MSIVRNPLDPEAFWTIHERVGVYAFIPRVNEPSNNLMRPIGFERQSEIIIVSDLDELSIKRRNEE